MKQMGLILAVLVLALATSCDSLVRDTLNVGHGRGHGATIDIRSPVATGPNAPSLFGNETAEFSADIIGVNGPFNISWRFGGAAEDTTSVLFNSGTSTVEVLLIDLDEETTFTATATLTDSAGIAYSDSVTFTVGPTQNIPPTIDSLTFSDGILTATASDPDNDYLEFSAKVLSGVVRVSGPYNTTATSASFSLVSEDILAGGNFSVQVTVQDGRGGEDSDTFNQEFKAFPLEPDTLYAIATSDRTSAGGNVRVVVATGDTANPFQYVNGCGVVCENGASYASQTFDVGNPDDTPDVGSANPIDGVWGDMGATSFLLAPDNFITGTDLGNGSSRTDFNVTPLGGSDITANGILFSFEYTFASAGTYHLGFEAVNIVSRTYYTDASQSEDFFWSDISNDHQYNVIVVE